MQQATFTITLEEVQLLNNIIANSTPNAPFGQVSQFIAKINTQLQEQFKEQLAQEEKTQEGS